MRTGIRVIFPWVICGLAAAFYCYEYLLRITPGLMVPELQAAFSINGQALDATMITYLSVFYYYAYTPMQLPVGLIIDRYGPRWILTLAVLFCAIGAAVFAQTNVWGMAASGRFLMGFGSAFAFVGVLKLASTWLPANRFALVSGLATTLGMVGAMIGGVMMTELIVEIGWRNTVTYSSYVGFILLPIIWLVVRDAPSKVSSSQKATSGTYSSFRLLCKEIYYSLRNSQIWLNGIIAGLIMAPTMVFPELWGKLYLQTLFKIDEVEATSTAHMIFLGWAIGGPIAGLISDKLGRRKWPITIGSLIAAAILLVFFYYPGLTLAQSKIILFLFGIFSSVQVICFAVGRENCPQSLAATAVAVTNFLVVSFSFFQVIVAKILDYTWDGVVVDSLKVYNAESFQIAMLVLPAAVFLAFILSFFLKETYCRPIDSPRREA